MDYQKYEGLSQALFEESNEARFLLNAAMDQVLEVNAAGQRLCGFAIRDLIGVPVTSLFRHEGRPGLGPLIGNGRRANRYDMGRCELRMYQPDVWLPVDVSVTRLCVKPELLYLARVKDASSVASQAKKDSALFRRLLASVPACLWTGEVTRVGEIRLDYMSPMVTAITGHPPELFGVDFAKYYEFVHPDDRLIRANANHCWALGKSTEIDYRFARPDGTYRRLWESVHIEPSIHDNCFQLFGVISDVTRLKGV
jgi:PAS domain-containing protein